MQTSRDEVRIWNLPDSRDGNENTLALLEQQRPPLVYTTELLWTFLAFPPLFRLKIKSVYIHTDTNERDSFWSITF